MAAGAAAATTEDHAAGPAVPVLRLCRAEIVALQPSVPLYRWSDRNCAVRRPLHGPALALFQLAHDLLGGSNDSSGGSGGGDYAVAHLERSTTAPPAVLATVHDAVHPLAAIALAELTTEPSAPYSDRDLLGFLDALLASFAQRHGARIEALISAASAAAAGDGTAEPPVPDAGAAGLADMDGVVGRLAAAASLALAAPEQSPTPRQSSV